MNKIGLYLHVPFCEKKCPYCDFYSVHASEDSLNLYTDCMIDRLKYNSDKTKRPADTLYFGGGTPGLLGGERVARLIGQARACFGLDGAEITAEVNPGVDLTGFLQGFRAAGGNRLSIGMQSADDRELERLGRRHTVAQAAEAVAAARKAGIENISLDLMLGIEGQTVESARRSAAFCAELGVPHVSAYLLKIEPRTAFYQRREQLQLPDEDETCSLYEAACEELERHGLMQYEISNFAKPGFRSRHNQKYWDLSEYLGLGPGAHSFMGGRRFEFARDLKAYIGGEDIVRDEDEVPTFQRQGEYLMVRLRTAEGVDFLELEKRYNIDSTPYEEAFRSLMGNELVAHQGTRWYLTEKGFLVSNSIINTIVEAGQPDADGVQAAARPF